MPRFSIVIVTYNEELYLPKLLKSIELQDYRDYEVIVSNSPRSNDNTEKIAKEWGAKVVEGGYIAEGRNNGAKATKGEYIIFLDADVELPKTFLSTLDKKIISEGGELYTAFVTPDSKTVLDRFLHSVPNLYIWAIRNIRPSAGGFCMIVSKKLFERVGGFDPTFKMEEDHDFVRRAAKVAPLHVITSPVITISTRRLDKEGRLNLAIKYLYMHFFHNRGKNPPVKYEFGKHPSPVKSKNVS